MAELKENQLLLLDNLIYLNEVTNQEGQTVEYVVDRLLKGELDKSRTDDPTKIGTNQEWPCLMSRNEWLEILNQIENDPVLKSMKITNGVDYTTDGTDDSGTAYKQGMRAACFVDAEGGATAVFRGTGGTAEWQDNGEGGYSSDTVQQREGAGYAFAAANKSPVFVSEAVQE